MIKSNPRFAFAAVAISFAFVTPLLLKGDPTRRPIFGETGVIPGSFRSNDFAVEVNRLRGLGRDRALAELSSRSNKSLLNGEQVLYLVLFVFDIPSASKSFALGEPQPSIRKGEAEKWGLFPFALVDGHPILLVRGFRMGGRGTSVEEVIKNCRSLQVATGRLKESVGEAHLKKFFAEKRFQELYENDEDRKSMEILILKQSTPRQP